MGWVFFLCVLAGVSLGDTAQEEKKAKSSRAARAHDGVSAPTRQTEEEKKLRWQATGGKLIKQAGSVFLVTKTDGHLTEALKKLIIARPFFQNHHSLSQIRFVLLWTWHICPMGSIIASTYGMRSTRRFV